MFLALALALAVHAHALELTLGANMHPHAFPRASMLEAHTHALALTGCPCPHRTLCWATHAPDTHIHVHVLLQSRLSAMFRHPNSLFPLSQLFRRQVI
jgi:hypothetical protein